MDRINRRTFAKSVLAGVGAAAAAPASLLKAAETSRKLKIGCTTLIWGGLPRTPENLEPALKDMSELGFWGFETFGSILEDWEKKGTLQPLLEKYPIPLTSAYTTVDVLNSANRKDNVEMLKRYAALVKKYKGTFIVQCANGRGQNYDFKANKQNIIESLNEYGKVVMDAGLNTGLHQHTGTAVDTRDETYAVMEGVDHRYMKFAPDIGQLQKTGADAAQVIKDFKDITPHMHFKDYKGWKYMGGYCPLGEGVVDLKSVLDTMEQANPKCEIMHELDGSADMPYTPRQTAEIAVKYLKGLGYKFRT